MHEEIIIAFMSVLLANHGIIYYQLGKIKQELKDIKRYVLKINGDKRAKKRRV